MNTIITINLTGPTEKKINLDIDKTQNEYQIYIGKNLIETSPLTDDMDTVKEAAIKAGIRHFNQQITEMISYVEQLENML